MEEIFNCLGSIGLLFQKIPLTKISEVIADWATFLAAIIALFTLRAMHTQRKHSYKPDIVPIEIVFNGRFQSPIFCTWIERNTEQYEYPNKIFAEGFTASLFNLGNGAAKEIHIEWDFPHLSFIKNLSEINKAHDTGVEINLLDSFLEFKDGGNRKAMVNFLPSLKARKDYLLPAFISESPLKLPLPQPYIWLVSNYFYLQFNVLSKELDFVIPDLSLKLKYSDIADNKYEKNYTFNIGIIFYSPDEQNPDFSAYLNFKTAN